MGQLTHPSSRLSSGEVTDFRTAMDLYRAQMEFENAQCRSASGRFGLPLTEDDHRCMKSLSEAAAKASEAANIYQSIMRESEARVVAKLREIGGDEFTSFADALESGDYSQLAI